MPGPNLVDRVHGKYIIRHGDSGRVPSLVDVSHSVLALHSTLLPFFFFLSYQFPSKPPSTPLVPLYFHSFTSFLLTS